MVSDAPSPRSSDDLDTDDETGHIFAADHRFSEGFRSLSIDSAGYSDYDIQDDGRVFAGTQDPGAARKSRRQRQSDVQLDDLDLYSYPTIADGDAFRLAVVQPGTGTSPIEASLLWENSKNPTRPYRCLSYAWESVDRHCAIVLDGYRFAVTNSLLTALQSLRRPKTTLLIWIDQICINQEDDLERGHQVSTMKDIFNRAAKIYVWLGEGDSRSHKLCEYAKKMRRGDDSPKSALNRILSPRELKYTIQRLLQRPWFQRVWVIPEVVLSRLTTIVYGHSQMSWENMVRLIRDVQLPMPTGFDKQISLLGNPRQRVAVITQMIASHKEALAHTDITALLILGKGSRATDARDMVYAFYGVTLLTTFPDYSRTPERLFVEIARMYASSILWESSYASWHKLTEQQKVAQLMSIVYSAGTLHQHYSLPSWVPDWTFSWHLAPVWASTKPNFVTGSAKDEWSLGIQPRYRAGGENKETFEVIENSGGMCVLKLSALVFDTIIQVEEQTPASTPGSSQILSASSTADDANISDLSVLRYGRHSFTTESGLMGLATPGIMTGDEIAILLGGNVPVVLRRSTKGDSDRRTYKLLCECFVHSDRVMFGDLLREYWTAAEDVILV